MITNAEWRDIAKMFREATPSSPVWFNLVDAILTDLIQEKIEETGSFPKKTEDA